MLVDYYSYWIEFDQMRDQTATETIALLLKQFSRRGLPDEIVSDCGKNFDSKEFSQFCRRKQIKHTKSSPHHHQSNDKAESAVKIAKSILRKTENSALNPYEALLDQHNTPTVDMTTSPAQRFLHRRLKCEIPLKATLLTPEIAETVLEEKVKKTAKSQMYYNRTAKDLSVLKPGDTVTIQPEGKPPILEKTQSDPNQKTDVKVRASETKKCSSNAVPRCTKLKSASTKPVKSAKKMDLVVAKRTRSGRLG